MPGDGIQASRWLDEFAALSEPPKVNHRDTVCGQVFPTKPIRLTRLSACSVFVMRTVGYLLDALPNKCIHIITAVRKFLKASVQRRVHTRQLETLARMLFNLSTRRVRSSISLTSHFRTCA